ncbi:hypothetical protein B0H13DRAFT_1883417 [Mycena leptocephala]|nr:hypothetical protein B0H13DRAFT_1883417 [Mycena leptocephala]
MTDVQAHTARLIALFVSCVLYGILLTTFVPCLRSLLFSSSQKFQIKPRHEIKFPILIATVLMFFVSSFSAVISMQDVIDAFINYHGPGGALEFYGTLHTTMNNGWTHWMPAVEDGVQVILGDALLKLARHRRAFRRLDRIDWCVLAFSPTHTSNPERTAAMSMTASYREITLKPGQSLNDPTVLPILVAALLLTFATSLITTYLIIRKLLKIEFDLKTHRTTQPHILTRIATIFFETGLIYTLSVVVSLAIYLTGSNLQYVVSLALIHIIGGYLILLMQTIQPITCNLLLIRVEGISRAERQVSGPHSRERKPWEGKFNPKAANEV